MGAKIQMKNTSKVDQERKRLLKLVRRPKTMLQSIFDLIFLPIRFLFPDKLVEFLHLTSLRAERMGMSLSYMKGRCLDIGCYDNTLIMLYGSLEEKSGYNAAESVGVDIFDWGGSGIVIKSSKELPFENNSFDTVTILASLNHIPDRDEVLREVYRVLKPNGKLIITMISRFVGEISHRVRYWGEHKHREQDPGEVFGMGNKEVYELLKNASYENTNFKRFLYGLNNLIISEKQA